MGHMRTTEMLAYAGRDLVLHDHLVHNHYPPLDPRWHDTAIWAIERGEEGDWNAEVGLMNGDQSIKTASQIIEELHLDAFLAEEG